MKKFHKQFQARMIQMVRKKNKQGLKAVTYWNKINHSMLKDEGMYDTEETKQELKDLIVRNNKLKEAYIRVNEMKDSKIFKAFWFIDRTYNWENKLIQYTKVI